MKKTVIGLISMFVGIANLYAQSLDEKMKKEDVVVGSIIKEDKEIRGYIKKMGIVYEYNKSFPN